MLTGRFYSPSGRVCITGDSRAIGSIGSHNEGGYGRTPFLTGKRSSLSYDDLRLKGLRLLTIFFPVHIVSLGVICHFVGEFT